MTVTLFTALTIHDKILTYRARYMEANMTYDEKQKKMSHDFSLLNEEQQDYILGILQALVFAKDANQSETETNQPVQEKQ